VTYIAQGWKVTDPAALADIARCPSMSPHSNPGDVLRMYARVTSSRRSAERYPAGPAIASSSGPSSTRLPLEARDRYDASYENESLAGSSREPDDLPGWRAGWTCSARPRPGTRSPRARGEPAADDYSRFGIWSRSSPRRGRDIRYLERRGLSP